MNEDFVTYELAVKLKEKGFPQDVFIGYDEFGTLCMGDEHSLVCDAPTIWQVLKWLREEKELHIEIYMYHNCYLWEIYNTKIYDADFTQKSEKYSEIEYESYEQTAIAGISYILDNLI